MDTTTATTGRGTPADTTTPRGALARAMTNTWGNTQTVITNLTELGWQLTPTPTAPTTVHRDDPAAAAWFDTVCDAVEDYLQAYVTWRDAPKSEQDAADLARLEAKARVIATFEAGR